MKVRILVALLALLIANSHASADDWTTGVPKVGLAPQFSKSPSGGPDGKDTLVIQAALDSGTPGWWKKSIPVEGDHWYRFTAHYRITGAATPTRSAVARLQWLDANGQPRVDEQRSCLAYVIFEEDAVVRCLRDGRVLFEALEMQFPSAAQTRMTVLQSMKTSPDGEVIYCGASLNSSGLNNENLMNFFHHGGYLAWELGPANKVAIDGHFVRPTRASDYHDRVLRADRDWESLLAQHNVRLILSPVTLPYSGTFVPLITQLSLRDDWQLVSVEPANA